MSLDNVAFRQNNTMFFYLISDEDETSNYNRNAKLCEVCDSQVGYFFSPKLARHFFSFKKIKK